MPLPYYRGCWHGISRGLFLKYRHIFFLEKRGLQPRGLRPSRGVAPSGFRPLRKIPHCCLPEESGPCLSPSVADHPLRPASHLWLGEPLPHQLPNDTRAHPSAATKPPFPSSPAEVDDLFGIIKPFGMLSRTKGQITHALLTRSPLSLTEVNYRSTCMC